jgi:murein tripeptide amidase MpaA
VGWRLFIIPIKSSLFFSIFISIGIHAREWISPATNIYIAHVLLSNYSKDPTITHIVDQFDYYILPVFNVDGYAYTWTNGRVFEMKRIL